MNKTVDVEITQKGALPESPDGGNGQNAILQMDH
jgi:hypothetical protein